MRRVTGDLKVYGDKDGSCALYSLVGGWWCVRATHCPLSSEYHDFYCTSKIWVTSNRTARFLIKFLFRSVTWYLRITLQCIWRILSLGCDGHAFVVDIYTFWNIESFFHSGYYHIPEENILAMFCTIEICFLQYFCVILLRVMTVTRVKFSWWNKAGVTFIGVADISSVGRMQHCHWASGVKTPGTAFPVTRCHDPEDRYLQGWNTN
jgi:hypothetical protein